MEAPQRGGKEHLSSVGEGKANIPRRMGRGVETGTPPRPYGEEARKESPEDAEEGKEKRKQET